MLEKSPQYRHFTCEIEWSFASFVPIFGRPPSSACISIKAGNEMIISKFWIRKVTRIFPSEHYFMRKCSSKKCPFTRQTAVKFC